MKLGPASIATALLMVALPGMAQSLSYRYVNNAVNWRSNEPITYNPQTWTLASSNASVGINGLTGNASVGGLIDWGIAKTFATGSGAGYYGLSQASWVDRLRIDAGSNNGQKGFVTFAIKYEWDLAYNHAAPVDLRGQVDIGLGDAHARAFQSPYVNCSITFGCATYYESTLNTFSDGGAFASAVGSISPAGASGVMYARMPVTFGTASALQASLSASVGYGQLGLYTRSVSSGDVHADHSMTWGGVVSVTDAVGVEVGYSLASNSGFDYSKPYVSAIPEPNSAQMTLVGLAGLLGLLATRARPGRPRPMAGAPGGRSPRA